MLKALSVKAPLLLFSSHTILNASTASPKGPVRFKSPHLPENLPISPPSFAIRVQSISKIQSFVQEKKRKRVNSDKSTRFLLNLISVVSSSLKILPRPLDLVLEEIGGADGSGGDGGQGFWKGFGWGGFDGWGRRRRGKRNLWLYGFLAICGLGSLFGREIESNGLWWSLGLGPFGVVLIQWWEKTGGVQAWVLGFCLWSFLIGLTFRREELQKWFARVPIPIPVAEIARRRIRRRNRGRVF